LSWMTDTKYLFQALQEGDASPVWLPLK